MYVRVRWIQLSHDQTNFRTRTSVLFFWSKALFAGLSTKTMGNKFREMNGSLIISIAKYTDLALNNDCL